MFEKLLQRLLKDVVGEFIDGIDTKKLNIGIWSGTVQIVNVSLKPRLLAILGLPYRITYSNISRLFIKIPWKNLFTAPLVIQIQNIQVLAENASYQLSREQEGKVILLKIKQFIQKLGRELASNKKNEKNEKAEDKSSGGYLENVYLKMLDNLYLTIRNIHFRFQVSRPLKQEVEATPFAFGITLQSIQIFATDEKGNRVFIDRTKLTADKNIIYKKLKLENFGFYWNYEEKETVLLSTKIQFPVKSADQKFLKEMLDLKQTNSSKGGTKQKLNYLILINAEGVVKEDNRVKTSSKITKYEISFNIKQIKMVLNEKIVKQAVWFMLQTSALSAQKKTLTGSEMLDKWEGPKNQNFLGILRKYCINEFWDTDSSGKNTIALSSQQERMLIDYLYENKQNLMVITNKVKQIIVGDIGSKNIGSKSEIINNWQSIEALMQEQKKMEEGQMQIKFGFQMQELSLFYLDEIKIPIAQLFIKGLKISAEQNQEQGLLVQTQIARLEGFGYDQNPIIRMEHEIQSPFKDPKVMKFSKLFYLAYHYKEDVGQEVDIALGGIGFLYDFKTFRQIYRLSEGLVFSQNPPTPTSPPSQPSLPLTVQNTQKLKRESVKRETGNSQKPFPSQITITIENISIYIQQYTKKTWRLSMSGCQLTNNESLVPQNILISAISFSVSDFYVCEPFGAKIVLSLRSEVPDVSVLIQPIHVKINSDVLKYLVKISSCLETYKKNDAISLSSKYGELYMLQQKQVWKKYDAVVIDGFLYLYQKNEQYSKYQLRVVNAIRKQSNKRDVIQLTVKPDQGKVFDKYVIIVRNQTQFGQWTKYLQDLSESNKKNMSKQQQRAQQISKIYDFEKQKQEKSSPKKINFCIMIEQLSFFALDSDQQKIEQAIMRVVVHKAIIELLNPEQEQVKQKEKNEQKIEQKPIIQERIGQSQQEFKSLKEIKFTSKFSKKSRQDTEFVSIVEKPEDIKDSQEEENSKKQDLISLKNEIPKRVVIQIKDVQYWYKDKKRLYFMDPSATDQKPTKPLKIELSMKQSENKVEIQIVPKICFNYEPYQILQTLAYLNNRILNVLSAPRNKAKNSYKQQAVQGQQGQGSQSEIKQNVLKAPVNVKAQLKILLSLQNGCVFNCFNLLDYKKQDQNRQRLLMVSASYFRVCMDNQGISVDLQQISGDWCSGEQRTHKLVSSIGGKNRISVQFDKKLEVKIYQLYLPNYKHYLTMRAIDYILVQLKQTLLYPYNFNQYYQTYFNPQDDRNSHTKMYRFKAYIENTMTQTQILERINNLFSIQVQIYQAYLEVQDVGYVTVGLINVTNQFANSFNYSIKSQVKSDWYLIEFKDLNIWLITQPKNQQNHKMTLNLQKQMSKKKQASNSQQNISQTGQQQRFYTVLNRFSSTLNEQKWLERVKSNLIQVINTECPLDMSIAVTMFGKYPEYKTIYPNFEPTPENTAMKIKLKLSQLHINLLPHQIIILNKFVNRVLQNLSFNDGNGYLYSYDQQVIKQIYQKEGQRLALYKDINSGKKNADFKLVYDAKNIVIITIPIQEIVPKDQYLFCPMQFELDAKLGNILAYLLPEKVEKAIKMQQMNQQRIQKKIEERQQQIKMISGIEANIQNFEICYVQYPKVQTKIMFAGLDISHFHNQTKNKIIELTSAAQRQSRETMFIDNSLSKKINQSRPDLFVNEKQKGSGQKNISNRNQKGIMMSNQKRVNQKQDDTQQMEWQSRIRQNPLLVETKDVQQAFSVKMFKKSRKQKSSLSTQEQKYETVSAIQLNLHNIIINYSPQILQFFFKFKNRIQAESHKINKDGQIKAEQIVPQQYLQTSTTSTPTPTEFLCRLHNLLLKVPLSQQLNREVQVSDSNYTKNYKLHQSMCSQIKCAVLTDIPLLMPLRVDVEYFQVFTEEMYEDVTDDQRDKSATGRQRVMINGNQMRNSENNLKNKRKTILQPTKIYLNRKISEQMLPSKNNKKQEMPQNPMSTRIKSILNIGPSSQANNQPGNQIKIQPILVPTKVVLNEIFVDRCFYKISIQDLKMLNKFGSNLSTQISEYLPKQSKPANSTNKTQKQQLQSEAQKKQIKKSGSLQQNINKNKSLVEQELPTVTLIQFKPLELVIMNDNNLTITPLIYSKVHIKNYKTQQFQLEIAANYFNLRINAWQPLVEKCLLLVKMKPHISIQKISIKDIKEVEERASKPQSHKSNKKNESVAHEKQKQFITINISTNFLQALIPALQSKTNDLSLLRLSEAKSVEDEVNCWLLINQLGYDISCESKSFHGNRMPTIINIPNNKTKKLTFLNDMFEGEGFQEVLNINNEEEQMLNINDGGKKNRWTITITINNQFKIKQIDIGEIGIKKFFFNYQGHPYWIYGHTYVDISKNVKYIKFYSDVMISNLTNLDLWVSLPGKQDPEPEVIPKINKKQELQRSLLLEDRKGQKEVTKQRRYSEAFNMKDMTSNNFLNVKGKQDQNHKVMKSQNRHSDEFFDDQRSSANERLQTSFQKVPSVRPNYVRIPSNKQISLAFDLDQNFKRINESEFISLISNQAPKDQDLQQSPQAKQKQAASSDIRKYQQFQIQKQKKKMRTIFKILPPGKIINKLPESINIALKADDHILYAYTLMQDESQFIYTLFTQLEISVHADGFQWSTFVPCGIVDSIALTDFNCNRLTVKVHTFFDQQGISNMILYPIAVLYNDTDYNLHVRDPDSKNYSYFKVLPKKALSLSNARVLVLKPSLPVETGFDSQRTSFTKVYMNQDEITCKFQVSSTRNRDNMIERQLQLTEQTAIEALLINQISLKTSGVGSAFGSINTKFVTASHKYYFSNQTQYTVLVRKYTGGDTTTQSKFSVLSTRTYPPSSTQSFRLFQQDSSTSKQALPYFELTLKNSPYEWSGALSITNQGSNHFVLRDRAHFNKVLFLNLVVIKYHKIDKYKIQLRVVEKSEVPFIIKNSWTGFLVKLPEFGGFVLKDGEQVAFSWDEPVLRGKSIPILVGQAKSGGFDKGNLNKFQILTENPDQNQIIKFKRLSQMGEIIITQTNNTKLIQIRQYQKQERKSEKQVLQIDLPIRIGIINNSFTPVYHLCDFSAKTSLKVSNQSNATIVRLNLDSIQIDNQTRYRVYFPVVLSTSLSVQAHLGKSVEIEVNAQPIVLNVEEDFGKDLYATAMLVSALFAQQKGIQAEINRIQNQSQISNKVLISKLSLPPVTIKLQVKTKKLSIETTINLEKPSITKYPWPSFPYPIKNIAITLLSHLSISPWALISSFQKGVVSLLTEQQSTKGIQGFFGQIIAALSNSVSGLVGILVGHDIERVEHFFDGIQQGSNLLVRQVRQIKDCFEPQECTIPSILTSLGYGIISIILKPMKGVLQMTLKISEGIKKTALFSFQDSQNRFKQRDAIVFYGQQQRFRTYSANQSQLMVMLLKICGQPLKYFHLLKFYTINNKVTNKTYVLCIGTEQVILCDAKKQKLVWQVNLHEVDRIQIVRYTVIKFNPSQSQVDVIYESLADEIYSVLIKIQKKVFIKA